MAKKDKKQQHHRRNGYESDDTNVSVAGSIASNDTERTIGDVEDNDEQSMEDCLHEQIDTLTEKRTTTRVTALKKIVDLLSHYVPTEIFHDNYDTLQSNALHLLRRPSSNEGVLGVHVLALIALMLGENEDSFYKQIKGPLQLLVKNEGQPEEVRAKALEVLGTTCFVCSGDQDNTLEILQFCEALFGDASNAVTTAALDTWGLLASTLPNASLVEDDFLATQLEIFMQLLDHADVEVRSAAGENIALLFEAIAAAHVYYDRDEIAHRLLALSKDSSKKTSKRDRKEQRTVFRDVYKTVADDVAPSITFTFQNEVLRLQDWSTLKQYNILKKWLHSGFQEHLKYNNVVRNILGLPLTTDEYTRVEKRDTLSKNSDARKAQSGMLREQRTRRQNQKNLFLADY
ncbi:hypothetical protein THRCLA_01763 [Thraustotheca clavata]|uniref:Interferon-related developmental regulator N-terminal domain-containing protein n=1 Tax=Thraustotheca clavata TaxID=74557 RepID=A0A1W0A7B6_9STRA|nr:hypothetical protein THRCLA_01763 [Thraustotheca clavata]